eukprot:235064-Chlamydomonas_euryale.AAC.1
MAWSEVCMMHAGYACDCVTDQLCVPHASAHGGTASWQRHQVACAWFRRSGRSAMRAACRVRGAGPAATACSMCIVQTGWQINHTDGMQSTGGRPGDDIM